MLPRSVAIGYHITMLKEAGLNAPLPNTPLVLAWVVAANSQTNKSYVIGVNDRSALFGRHLTGTYVLLDK